MKIAHISDLHHTSPNYIKEWGENLLEILDSINPELLIITGDLTNEGHIHEYEIAQDYIEKIKIEKKLIVPGNHDARNGGYKIFEEIYKTRFPYFENDKIIILGLDSTEPDIDDGHIGRGNYKRITDKISENKKLKIIALHHHIIPIPGTGRERNILVDSGEVLKLFTELKTDFVLSGHKHLPWVWKLEKTYFITAGTATSRRLKGRSYPSCNIMEIDNEKILITEINVINNSSRKILKIDNIRK